VDLGFFIALFQYFLTHPLRSMISGKGRKMTVSATASLLAWNLSLIDGVGMRSH